MYPGMMKWTIKQVKKFWSFLWPLLVMMFKMEMTEEQLEEERLYQARRRRFWRDYDLP